MTNRFVKGVIKLCLNLTILVGLVLLIRYSYQLFTISQENPLKNSILLILGFIAWILVIKLSKSRSRHYLLRYKGVKPSFKLTTFSVIAILLIFTFAGVPPTSVYKDNLVESWTIAQAERQKEQEKREAELEKERKERVAEMVVIVPPIITEALPKSPSSPTAPTAPTASETIDIRKAEETAFALINMYREENGVPPTLWDDELYKLSKAHTQEMASRGETFHGSGTEIGENAWGGSGYSKYSNEDLAIAIAVSWANSPLHNAWLLHAPIKESVVSIVVTSDGQYASWTFWMNRLNSGPKLVEEVAREWKSSGSNLDWLDWLYSKGYL